MNRLHFRLILAGLILPTCWLSGCTVDVDRPGDATRVDVDPDPPKKVDVDIDVDKTP